MLGKDEQELVKAYFLDANLNLTSAGNATLMKIMFKKFKKELVADAKKLNDKKEA